MLEKVSMPGRTIGFTAHSERLSLSAYCKHEGEGLGGVARPVPDQNERGAVCDGGYD